MRIVYHLGAHCTDEERLIRCLLKNQDILSEQGIIVPEPNSYRKMMRDISVELKGESASPEQQSHALGQILNGKTADRVILSWESFLSFPQWALRGSLYGFAGERVRAFTQVLPHYEAQFALAIRNPATFLPALFERQKGKTYEEFIEGADPRSIRWSDVIRQITAQSPQSNIILWCDEESPLIWPEVLQAVSGHDDTTQLRQSDELLEKLMNPEGLARMRNYVASHPPANNHQRRRIAAAFLEKFALPDALSYKFDLPGWSEDMIEEISASYREDIERIADLPQVDLISA